MDDLDDQIEYWQAMVEDINDGLETLAPRPEPDSKHRARKRRRLSNDADPDSHNKSEDVDPPTIKYEDDSKHQSITGHPLRVEEFKIKIAKLRATRKDARKSKVDIDLEVRVIRGKQDEIQMAESELVSETTSACISGRNDYIKATIRRDYAIEIKELDLDLAAEADEDSGPREDLRDYDVLARDFPVFCVSSRGYQKLKGWLGTGKSAVAFKSLEETEIPLLQKHCVRLTEPGRVANSQHFLVKLTQLLNSLALWASGGNVDNGLTAEQKATRERQLAKSMDHLKRDFEQTVKDTVEELHKGLKESIFVRYEVAVQTAADSAMGTIQHWAKPVDKEDHALGGFYWNTYQAICRRDGVYKFKKQPIDWNDALATPMTKKIIPGWEEMFTHRLAPVMALFALRLADVITVCHREIEREAGTLRVNDHALRMLQRQVDGYAAVFDGHAQAIKGSINSAQKTINRQFVLIIKNVLRPVYAACANEHGFKTYTRMKEHMHSYMQNKGFSMFRDSVDDVRRRLLQLITEQEKAMSNRVNGVFDAVRRDYVSVLIGGNVPNAARLREARQEMRREVMELLESTDHIFEKVLSQPQKSKDRNVSGGNGHIADHRTGTLEEAEGGELQHVRTDAAQAAGEEAFA